MKNTFNILFFMKRSKLLKNGNAPIYARVTLRGKSAEFSLNRSLQPNKWKSGKHYPSGRDKESCETKEYMKYVNASLWAVERELAEKGTIKSPKTIVDHFLGKQESKAELLDFFEKELSTMEKMIDKGYAKSTCTRYRTTLKHLKSYVFSSYGNNCIMMHEIDTSFLRGFDTFLRVNHGCQQNTVVKHMRALQKVVRIAFAEDIISSDPFRSFKLKTEPVNREWLTQDELNRLESKTFDIKRISIIRDLFLVQCYSGLSFKDLQHLRYDNVQSTNTGFDWIVLKRFKTNNLCRIPILPIVERLIKKYVDYPGRKNGKMFPVPSNQKMNSYLKEIADLCGIKKNLTSHMGRHTFATTVALNNGVSMEVLAEILGHKKLQTTQIYGKILEGRISSEMDLVKKKIE